MFCKKGAFLLLASLIVAGFSGCGGAGGQAATTGGGGSDTKPALLSISVEPVNPTIAVSKTQQFTATGTYINTKTVDLTSSVIWTASDSALATITSSGLATGEGAGVVTITASLGGVSGSTAVTVTAAALVSLSVTPVKASIGSGATEQFTATGTFSDNTTHDMTTTVNWTSSNSTFAKISSAGLATGVSAGFVTVTASLGGITGSAALTITPASLVSIAISPATASIASGGIQQFTAAGTYSDNSVHDVTTTVTWSSSDSTKAKISSAGVATGIAAGSATISATSGTLSGSAALIVTPATLVSIAVTPSSASIGSGASKQFAATGTFSDNSTQILTTTAAWNSSAAGVATVSNTSGSKGLVTGVSAGTAIITASSGAVSGTASVTVTGGGVATLSWSAPTSNADGSVLDPATGISLYKIYYGTSSGTYTTVVNVPNPATSTITKSVNLSSGTYYFVVTAVNSSGQESGYSNEGMKMI